MVSRKSTPGHPGAHDVKSLACPRLAAGSYPLYIYLRTQGSVSKSPEYPSCVTDDGALIATLPTRERARRELCLEPSYSSSQTAQGATIVARVITYSYLGRI